MLEARGIPGGFWSDVARASKRVLLLDYDGTLAPFRRERDRARPYPGVSEVLDEVLEARHTRLVIVTGRAVADLVGLLDLQATPEIWGSHGLERLLADGTNQCAQVPAFTARALSEARSWVLAHVPTDLVEEKPGCVALHWRGLPASDVLGLRHMVRDAWSRYAEGTKLALREFDGGLELRATLRTKADAVLTIQKEERGSAVTAYLGDDDTDEDAFRAIKGNGLGILVREEHRPTAAQAWLRPPAELLSFLRTWHRVANEPRFRGE
jgi:trehalose 6-phosphate phosphatase